MNKIAALFLCFIFIFLCAPACDREDSPAPGKQETQADPGSGQAQELNMTELIKEAHAKYDKALEAGKTKEQAVKEVVDFLKSKDKVKEVKVTSPDTLRVLFTDEEEIVLMLGRGRL